MIALSDVHKSYPLGPRRVPALRGLSFSIDQAGFYAVMGPSGSGKSTLLHLLAGLDRPDSGSVEIAGTDLAAMSEKALTVFRRRTIGIVFQQFNLIPTMTAVDNVALPAVLDGRPEREARARAEELLTSLGLGDRLEHRPDALSGGEQQRIAMARALFFDPPILLADEPTGNLDSTTSRTIWSMLAELPAQRKITVLMVTHEPDAASYCRHVFVLRDGRLAGDFEVTDRDPGWLANRCQLIGDAAGA